MLARDWSGERSLGLGLVGLRSAARTLADPGGGGVFLASNGVGGRLSFSFHHSFPGPMYRVSLIVSAKRIGKVEAGLEALAGW